MSNKRIQKKQAKAEWQRDKSKLIAEFLVTVYPGRNRFEYLRLSEPLWELDKDVLIGVIQRATMREVLRRSPFINMLPRKTYDASTTVNWRTVVSNHGVK